MGTSTKEMSYAELRRISASNIEMHNKLNQIIDLRQQELAKARDSLYVEVQNFREAHQAEVRRSLEVTLELAAQSLPWWGRSLAAIQRRAAEMLPMMNVMVRAEAQRIKDEADRMQAEEKAQGEIDQQMLLAKKEEESRVQMPQSEYGEPIEMVADEKVS